MNDFLCLDCHHLKPVSPQGGTGYATLTGEHDPSETNHFVCYACSNIREAADFAKADRYFAYLSGDTITAWPGGVLARVTSQRERTLYGFGGSYKATYVRATAPDGSRWYGRGPGNGMYVRLRRVKS